MATEQTNPIADLFYKYMEATPENTNPATREKRLRSFLADGWEITLPDITDTRSKLKYDYDCYVNDVFAQKLSPLEICELTHQFMKREHDLMWRAAINDDESISRLQHEIDTLRQELLASKEKQ